MCIPGNSFTRDHDIEEQDAPLAEAMSMIKEGFMLLEEELETNRHTRKHEELVLVANMLHESYVALVHRIMNRVAYGLEGKGSNGKNNQSKNKKREVKH